MKESAARNGRHQRLHAQSTHLRFQREQKVLSLGRVDVVDSEAA